MRYERRGDRSTKLNAVLPPNATQAAMTANMRIGNPKSARTRTTAAVIPTVTERMRPHFMPASTC